MEEFRFWVESTWLSEFVRSSTWVWAASETVHFVGLAMLVGSVGLLDLRMLGMAKTLPLSVFLQLAHFGVLGFSLNLLTGIAFFSGAPDQYMYNSAFHAKAVFMLLAGANAAAFHWILHPRIGGLGPGQDAPVAAKIIAGASLLLWVGVMAAGRLLTFYRPPF